MLRAFETDGMHAALILRLSSRASVEMPEILFPTC